MMFTTLIKSSSQPESWFRIQLLDLAVIIVSASLSSWRSTLLFFFKDEKLFDTFPDIDFRHRATAQSSYMVCYANQ